MTYQSPYGRAEGIGDRLADWSNRLGTDKTLPWIGLGIIDDLRKAAEMLGSPKVGLPLGEARAEVFASLASTPVGERALAQPEPELEDWEKGLASVQEFDL